MVSGCHITVAPDVKVHGTINPAAVGSKVKHRVRIGRGALSIDAPIDVHARAAGLETTDETGLDGPGPGSFMLTDPDGNPVLIDQHV